jgi:MFS family permease
MSNLNLKPGSLAVGGHSIHYAWVIVLVASFMRLATSSFRSSASVLIPFIVQTFGWSVGAVGIGFSLQWVVSGLAGPAAGWLGDRYGARVTLLLGAVLFMIGMVLTGMMNHLWQFYLFFGVVISISMAITQVPLTVAVTLWFKKHLGVGMGLLHAAQGIGPLFAVPVVLLILYQFGGGETGVRASFWIPGLAGGLLLIALVKLFYNEPADIGLKPLGTEADVPVQRTQKGEVAQLRTRVFLKRVQRTPTFWNLIGIHYWGCAGHAVIVVYLATIAVEQGISPVVAAGAFVTMQVVSSLTRFIVPIVADNVGSKGVMAACFFLQVAPVFLLFFAQDAWMFYLFAVLFGIGFGGEMTAFPIINRQYYGGAPVGTTYGWQMMGAGLGMASGALLGGLLRDWTGDFNATIALSLILSMVGVISILLLPTTTRLQVPDWEEALPPEMRPSAQRPQQAHTHGD